MSRMIKNVWHAYFTNDRIVGGGDGVEDPLNAFELLLVAGGDSIKSLVVVLQRSTALTEEETRHVY